MALSELVGRSVILLDGMLRPVTQQVDPQMHWDPTEAYIGRVLQTMAVERRSMRLPPLPAWGVTYGCVLAPVSPANPHSAISPSWSRKRRTTKACRRPRPTSWLRSTPPASTPSP